MYAWELLNAIIVLGKEKDRADKLAKELDATKSSLAAVDGALIASRSCLQALHEALGIKPNGQALPVARMLKGRADRAMEYAQGSDEARAEVRWLKERLAEKNAELQAAKERTVKVRSILGIGPEVNIVDAIEKVVSNLQNEKRWGVELYQRTAAERDAAVANCIRAVERATNPPLKVVPDPADKQRIADLEEGHARIAADRDQAKSLLRRIGGDIQQALGLEPLSARSATASTRPTWMKSPPWPWSTL
jgi:hypothetical protein